MNKAQLIVQIFLDLEGWKNIPTTEWVKDRMDFFHEFTLKSLLNQSFRDFRIFILCGKRNKAITSAYPWHERVEVCYDKAQGKYKEIDADYVAITRIDSDDLFHKEALQEVKESLYFNGMRGCLAFKKNLRWDMVNRFVGTHYRHGPPFFTHIIPKHIYKNWDTFCRLHYVPHGVRAGSNSAREMSKHKVCVIKHPANNSIIKRREAPWIFAEETRKELEADQHLDPHNRNVIFDSQRMKEILEDFSIPGRYVQ